MLLIHCPCCQEAREEEEFRYAGEAYLARPANPDELDEAAWGEYLFYRKNPRGWHWEQWQHVAGCRKIFVMKRHLVSYDIAGTWTLDAGKALYLEEQS